MKRESKTKFRQLVLTAVLVMATMITSLAQIFLIDDDDNIRLGSGDVNGELSNLIIHGDVHDQTNWVPLTSGAALLSVLGGAYLLKKRRSQSGEEKDA